MSARRLIPVVLVSLAAGCDPGYTYKPVDAAGQPADEWSIRIDDVRFSCGPHSLLVGSRGEFLGLQVANGSKYDVEVLSARLETDGRTLPAKLLPDPENRKARIVPAGETRTVSLLVDFGDSADKALGKSVAYVWRVRVGALEREIRAELRRE